MKLIPEDRSLLFENFTDEHIKDWVAKTAETPDDWETITTAQFGEAQRKGGRGPRDNIPGLLINPKRGDSSRPAQCSLNDKTTCRTEE